MSQLTVIKDRIKTISSLNKVTKAMEMVTRTKIHSVRQNSLNAKKYQEAFTRLISGLAPENIANQETPQRYGVAFFSHKGFCGAFNDKLLSRLRAVNRVSLSKNGKLYLLGRAQPKWNHVFREYQHIEAEEKNYQTQTASLLTELTSAVLSGRKVEIYFIYNQLISILEQKPHIQKIYPLESPALTSDTWLEPKRSLLYPEALRGYLTACLERAYWESMAGEYYARLLSMKSANENADIMLNKLNLDYNKTRQTFITQELSEVISAFDVLNATKKQKGI